MEFNHVASVAFGGKIVTIRMLRNRLGKRWPKRVIDIPDVNEASDSKVLTALLAKDTPYLIVADTKGEPLVLEATLRRFPYSIDEVRHFVSCSLRLVPKQGRIRSIIPYDFSTTNGLRIYTDHISADLGNGSLFLEIFFRPKKVWGELKPPANFKEEHFTSHFTS